MHRLNDVKKRPQGSAFADKRRRPGLVGTGYHQDIIMPAVHYHSPSAVCFQESPDNPGIESISKKLVNDVNQRSFRVRLGEARRRIAGGADNGYTHVREGMLDAENAGRLRVADEYLQRGIIHWLTYRRNLNPAPNRD